MKQSKMKEVLVTIVGISLLEAFFFYNAIDINALIGSNDDGQFNNFILEHWFRFFSGKEAWNDVRIFYPMENTLAYSDPMFIFGLPYSLLRMLEMNMYLSMKYILIIVHVIGSCGFYVYLRKYLSFNQIASFAGLIIFSYSAGYRVCTASPQLFTISFVPFLLIMIHQYLAHLVNRKGRLKYGFGSILIIELMLYNGVYMAYFTAIFILICAMVCLVIVPHAFKRLFLFVKQNILEFLAYIATCIIINIPFMMCYLPSQDDFGSRAWSLVVSFIPNPSELVDIKYTGEGISLVAGVFLLVAIAHSFALLHRGRNKMGKQEYLLSIFSISIILTVLLFVKIKITVPGMGERYFAGWYILYRLIPGVGSMRAVQRMFVLLTIPLGIVTAAILEHIHARGVKGKRMIPLAISISSIVLLLADSNIVAGVSSDENAAEHLAVLDNIEAPPEDCEIIYLMDSVNIKDRNVTAGSYLSWEIANRYDLKMLNGNSGQFPEGWYDTLRNITSKNAIPDAISWVEKYNLEHVYWYDRGTNEWTKYN